MAYQKTFDELLEGILTDYENLDDAPDTSKGSMAFIKSAVLASALWGIYRYQEWIFKQSNPLNAIGKAEGGTLDDWCALFGIYRATDENDTQLLQKLLTELRDPPAGGNKVDYVRWAKEVNGVGQAWIFVDEDAQGLGSIDLVVTGPNGTEVFNSTKRQEVWDYIDARRPAGSYLLRILPLVTVQITVTMTLGGGSAVPYNVMVAITAYINSLAPGQTLYRSQLIAIAIGQGALNPVVTLPAADVSMNATTHEKAIAWSISVT